MTVHNASPPLSLSADHDAAPLLSPSQSAVPLWVAYAIAVVASGIAFAGDVFVPSLFTVVPFVLGVIAVVASAWIGGLLPGLLATVLGAVAGGVLLVHTSSEPTWRLGVSLAMFVALNILIAVLSEVRLRAARRVAQARSQLITVLRGLSDGVLLEDPKRGLVFANDAAAQLTGFASGVELQRATLRAVTERFDFLDPQGRPVPVGILPNEQAMHGEHHAEILFDVRDRATGHGRWWTMKATPLTLNGATGAVTIFRDVTAQQEAEATLAESERRSRALIEHSTDAFALLDAHGLCLFASPAIAHVLGYHEDELRGVNVFSVVHPDDVADLTAVFAALRTTPTSPTANVRMRHRDGRWRLIEATASNLMDDPAVRAMLINLRDVTDRQAAEDALAESERRWRALIENSADAVSVANANGQIAYTSPSMERILGHSASEFTAANGFAFIHPVDLPHVRELYQTVTESPGAQVRSEHRMRHKSGTYRWVAVTATNLLLDPAVRGIVTNYHDITDRKQAEKRQQFLRDARQQLTVPSNHEDAVVGVAAVAIPQFATGVAVELLGGTGKLRRAFTALPPGTVSDLFGTTPAAAYVARTLITGQSALFSPASPVNVGQDGSVKPSESATPDTMLVVPLVASGATIGAVTFASSVDIPFDQGDRQTAEAFAGLLTLALAQTRLHVAVQTAETRFRLLFDGIHDAVAVADADGTYTEANPALMELLGYSLEEVRHMHVGAFAVEPEQAWEAFVANHDERIRSGETTLRRKNGTLVPSEEWVIPVRLPDGMSYLLMWRSIPER